MTLENLKIKLCRYGNLQILKEGVVFSVLITGKGMTNSDSVIKIKELIMSYVGEKFPIIEAMRNEEDFLCLILKPKKP